MKIIEDYLSERNNYTVSDKDRKTITTLSTLFGVEDIKKGLSVYLEKYPSSKSLDLFKDSQKLKPFLRMKSLKKENIDYPKYIDNLDPDAMEAIIDTHDEILMKCCGTLNKLYEPIMEKLYKYFTEDKIPFWCMSGVLYHDIFIKTPVEPVRVLAEMGKKGNFIILCRAQWQRVQVFKKKNPNIFKDIVKGLK